MAEALSWQNRPLEAMYPVVFFDALRVKIRDDGVVRAVYLAVGVQADGQRDVLGRWIEQTEDAKFWLDAFNEPKTRGCQDSQSSLITASSFGKGPRKLGHLHRAPDHSDGPENTPTPRSDRAAAVTDSPHTRRARARRPDRRPLVRKVAEKHSGTTSGTPAGLRTTAHRARDSALLASLQDGASQTPSTPRLLSLPHPAIRRRIDHQTECSSRARKRVIRPGSFADAARSAASLPSFEQEYFLRDCHPLERTAHRDTVESASLPEPLCHGSSSGETAIRNLYCA
ncbi:transposase, Mutator family protein [Burkholderia pseudomallei ABCPW 107]|nr:transposase, Mutator family protein [Burkholderia pseudomallei ABCPW 107]